MQSEVHICTCGESHIDIFGHRFDGGPCFVVTDEGVSDGDPDAPALGQAGERPNEEDA